MRFHGVDSSYLMKHLAIAALSAMGLAVFSLVSVSASPRVVVVTDDAVATLSIAINLALDQNYRDGNSRYNHIVAINNEFRSGIDHPFVLRLRDLLFSGQIGAGVALGLTIDAPAFGGSEFELVRFGSTALSPMLSELADFYSDCDMPSYLHNHEALYVRAKTLLEEGLNVEHQIRFLERFWGMQFSEYMIVPVPTLPVWSAEGATIRFGDEYIACYLVGPMQTIPTARHALGAIGLGYHQTWQIGMTAVHEFGHSFYGVALADFHDLLVDEARVLIPQTEVVPGYGPHELNWGGYVEEYFVRAIDTLYTSISRGTDAAEAELYKQEMTGFGSIRFFYDHVLRYHESLQMYDGFSDYVQQVIEDLRAMREAT